MPNIFKALATISSWILFIFGILSFIFGFMFMSGRSIDLSTTNVWCIVDSCYMMGAVMLILAVCAMVLRRKME